MTGISIERVTQDEAARALLADAPPWMQRVLARTDRLFRIRAPHMPGLVCIGATIALDDAGARAFGGGSISGTGTSGHMAGAIAGCLGELAESRSLFERDGDLAALPSSLPRLDDGWVGAALADNVIGDWLKGRNPISGEEILIPADVCLRRAPERRVLAPVGPLSAGCATGETFEDAASRAILELIERDAAAIWWLGGRRARPVAGDHPAAAEAAAFLAGMRAGESTRRTILLDITTDIGAAVIAAASHDDDGRGFSCGLAARADPAEAAKAAIRELGQMELAADLARAKLAEGGEAALNETDRRNLKRAACQIDQHTLLVPDNDTGRDSIVPRAIESGLSSLLDHLADHDIRVYLVKLRREDIGAPVVRAIAPRLQPFVKHITTPRFAAARVGGGSDDDLPLY